MLIQPPENDEASCGPGPGENGNGRCDQQGGHQDHEGDAYPEERKEDGSAEGKGDSGETKCDEEKNWEEGEEKLKNNDRLIKVRLMVASREGISKGAHKEKRPVRSKGGRVLVRALARIRGYNTIDGAAGIGDEARSSLVGGVAVRAGVLGRHGSGSCRDIRAS
jgi:hypothetical protein